ncbi:hypothetical protein PVAG01_06154 [Phlyctema vagabunda]|uniref:Uncharacterized protein n=1 Tax=Phlyctema vagabunda TaxID=108571 RepID=A0ABR4PF94_9HELO
MRESSSIELKPDDKISRRSSARMVNAIQAVVLFSSFLAPVLSSALPRTAECEPAVSTSMYIKTETITVTATLPANTPTVTVENAKFYSTQVLPCATCDPELLWVWSNETLANQITITDLVPVVTTTVMPCRFCESSVLPVAASVPSSVPTAAVAPVERAVLAERSPIAKRDLWGEVSFVGFTQQRAVGLENHYCGDKTAVQTYKELSPMSAENQNSAQEYTTFCVNYYYSNIASKNASWRADPLTIVSRITRENREPFIECTFTHKKYDSKDYCAMSGPTDFGVAVTRKPCAYFSGMGTVIETYQCLWKEYGTTAWINDFIANRMNGRELDPSTGFFQRMIVAMSDIWKQHGHSSGFEVSCAVFNQICVAPGFNPPADSASDDEINIYLFLESLYQWSQIQALNINAYVTAQTWGNNQANTIFETLKRATDPPAPENTGIFDFFVAIAGTIAKITPLGMAFAIIEGTTNAALALVTAATGTPTFVPYVPDPNNMNAMIGDIFNKHQMAAINAYSLVLGTKSVKENILAALALEGGILSISIAGCRCLVSFCPQLRATTRTHLRICCAGPQSDLAHVGFVMLAMLTLLTRCPRKLLDPQTGLLDMPGNVEFSEGYRVYPITFNPPDDGNHAEWGRDYLKYEQIDKLAKYNITPTEVYAGSIDCQKKRSGGNQPVVAGTSYFPAYQQVNGAEECFFNLPVVNAGPDTPDHTYCKTEAEKDDNSCDGYWRGSDSGTVDQYTRMSWWGLSNVGIASDDEW